MEKWAVIPVSSYARRRMCVISFMALHKNMESFKTWTHLVNPK